MRDDPAVDFEGEYRMTTRITLAILLTTWVVLIVGETAAFLTARQSLLALLDDTLLTRATRILEESAETPAPDAFSTAPPGDRYEIRDAQGAVIARTATEHKPNIRPTLTSKSFEVDPSGRRVRTITLKTMIIRNGQKQPITIRYWRPVERFDWLLSHLAGMLLLISLACGLTTAWLALKLSRAALRPLHETADVIAQIDEQNLARRIEAGRMPIELQPMSERLNEMLARLQNVFQQRKQFLADAAHELRTPTASLLTTLEVALRRPRDQTALMETLNSGLADARRLKKLVEQLMEQARSERARGPEAMQQSDVPALVRECVQIIAPLAAEKQVSITADLPESLPFVTQRDRLRSVVLNLLSNAVEYNKVGGTVRVRCYRDDGSLQLMIQDTGQGISPEHLPHVFEPFYRGGNGRGDDPSHLGLGLFLVRSHVEALSGQCHIESRPGNGTILQITLPEPKSV
jgi:signal transduction histidine kinase